MRLIDADELKRKITSWLRPVTDELNMVDADNVTVSVIMEIEEAPTVDPIELLETHGFSVLNAGWIRSKPCYVCKEKDDCCVSCSKVEEWRKKERKITEDETD